MTENEVWVGRGGLGTGKRVSAARDTLRATLEDFASTLEQARFRVYRPGAHWTFIGFAREVDGQWCSATVEASDFGNSEGWRWLMKIVPSREDGSSMFLPAVPDGSPLTVETATEVTLPRATNRVLSQPRDNAGWPAHWPVPEAREVHAFSTEEDFALLPLCYQTEGNIVTGGTTMSPIPSEVTCPACLRGMRDQPLAAARRLLYLADQPGSTDRAEVEAVRHMIPACVSCDERYEALDASRTCGTCREAQS